MGGLMSGVETSVNANITDMITHANSVVISDIHELNKEFYSGYQWIACLDSTTCLACANLDNKIFDRLPGMEGEGMEMPDEPPLHHHCRCIIVPVLQGMENDPSQTQVNYKDWFDGQDEDTQLDILGPARYKEYLNGKEVTSFARNGIVKTLKELKIDRITRADLIKNNIFEGNTIKELVKVHGDLPGYFDKLSEDDWQKIVTMVKNGETGNVGRIIISKKGIINAKGDVIVSKNTLIAIGERQSSVIKEKPQYEIVSDKLKEIMQNESNETFKNFTEDQKKAMNLYTNNGYDAINSGLRNADLLIPQAKETIEHIDTIMNSAAVKNNLIVFRGTQAKYYNDWNVGDIKEFNTYMSTTVTKEIVIEDFSNYKKPMFIEILVLKGTKGLFLGTNSACDWEDELLLDRNLKYRVLEKTEDFMKLLVL